MEQETTNPEPPPIDFPETPKPIHNNKHLILTVSFIIFIIVLTFVTGASLFIQNKKTTRPPSIKSKALSTPEPTKIQASVSEKNPSILVLKNGNLFSVQLSDLVSKQLTNGGGLKTTNQHRYWYSPDKTKIISKQNKTLLLITKDGSEPFLQSEIAGDVQGIAWRSDSNAIAIWQVLEYEETGMGLPVLSELDTYDLVMHKFTKVKQFNVYGNVATWEKSTNSIGYTMRGGEGGAFGEYHIIDGGTGKEKIYKTSWLIPSTTPDTTEFVVFMDGDEQGTANKFIKMYSILNPDKPLRTFPSPNGSFRCSVQRTSNREYPSQCLGVEKSVWYVDGSLLKAFDTLTGIISDIAILPTVQITVPSKGTTAGNVTLLDISNDKRILLIEQQITFNQSEYKIYDLNTKQITSLGFTKIGSTLSQNTSKSEEENWTHEAMGFIY